MALLDFDDLVRSLYEASAGLTDFDRFLQNSNSYFQSDYCAFMSASHRSSETRISGVDGMSRSEVALYNRVYAEKNPMLRKALPGLMAGEVVKSTQCISNQELNSSEFYSDWMQPAKLHYSIGFAAISNSDWVHNVVLARAKGRGDYSDSISIAMAKLAQHFRTAMTINNHIDEIHARCVATWDVLDRLHSGVIFLDRFGRVIQANRAAKQILDEGQLLLVKGKYLSKGKIQSKRLDWILASVKQNPVHYAERVFLIDTISKRRCCISVFSFQNRQNEFAWAMPRAAFVVFVSDSKKPNEKLMQTLASDFGLTARETDLVVALADGSRLAVAAKKIGVSLETAKSHRQHIYLKLGIHSSAELQLILHQMTILT